MAAGHGLDSLCPLRRLSGDGDVPSAGGCGALVWRPALPDWLPFVPTILTLLALGSRRDFTRRGALTVLVLVTLACLLIAGLPERPRIPSLYTPPLLMFFLLACFLVLNTLDRAESFVKERRARRVKGPSGETGVPGEG